MANDDSELQLTDTDSEMQSVRSGSPAPSTYSFHSSIDGRILLRDCHGRVLNNLNELYMWPATKDDEERMRLDIQHEQYKLCIGGLYVPKKLVNRTLAPRDPGEQRPAILDVGSGTGSWAIEMAVEFPHCDVVGVDLAPNVRPAPDNCRFEFDDANLGFPHYASSFDVIHARAIGGGITDFPRLHREFADILRPQGVLLLADGDLQLFDRNKQAIALLADGEPGFSWTNRIFFTAYNAMKSHGASVDSPYLNPLWLQDIEQFENVENRIEFIPVGPWTNDPHEYLISEMVRTNVILHMKGMRPLLLSEGYFEESVDRMLMEAEFELKELRVHIYTRWHFTWATRKSY